MKRKIFPVFIVLGLIGASLTSAEATEISGVSTYGTSSQMMVNMELTVEFADGSSWNGLWANLDSDSSGVRVGTTWSFTNDAAPSPTDDTYWNYWTLSTSVAITSITLDGIDAGVLFDIWDSSIGTPGSAYGWLELPSGWTSTVSDAINLTDASAVGDLWGSITLTNASGFTGTAQFGIDTDKTLASETPEPATMILFGIGLLGFGVKSRKRIFKA